MEHYEGAMTSGWMDELQVFCVDVGSIPQGNFGWARRHPAGSAEIHDPGDIESLVAALELHLRQGRPVALGLEMPLFLPVAIESERLGTARSIDVGAPAWSSGVGASSMATGAVQLAWLLGRIHDRTRDAPLFLRWGEFSSAQEGIFLWEAFVSGAAKGSTHEEDAMAGIDAFCAELPEPGNAAEGKIERPFSLAAAIAMWAGWELGHEQLRQGGIVVRA